MVGLECGRLTEARIRVSLYSLLSPNLMHSTESNTDSKYSLLSPNLMYSTENDTDSMYCTSDSNNSIS